MGNGGVGGGCSTLADRIRAEKEGKMVGAQKVNSRFGAVVGLSSSEQKEGKISKSALRRQKQQRKKQEEEAKRKEWEAEQKQAAAAAAAEEEAKAAAMPVVDPAK